MKILHHGATGGVTGSCHELQIDARHSVLVDCGLFQGAERAPGGRAEGAEQAIAFPLDAVRALLVTHCHIDHVGRIPHLIAAGFRGPIYCSEATAILLPLVLEDALKVGVTRDPQLIRHFLRLIKRRLRPLPYASWTPLPLGRACPTELKVRLQPAGHILGSAYVECRVGSGKGSTRVLFSGDLGPPDTPLLPAPRPPWGTDILVLESTYGDRLHGDRRGRRERLREVVESCLRDRGAILIPAFSIGRTQELLYELEGIIHQCRNRQTPATPLWEAMEVILDSPLAARFTESYRRLKPYWDAEAQQRLRRGRHPLSFEQLYTIDRHSTHQRVVAEVARSGRPSIIIAASGMCTGGRVTGYLKALLGDPRTDVLFVGYQAEGTPGRAIQRYGPRGGYVELEGERYPIRARIHTLDGYSAHADQGHLVSFVRRMRRRPQEVRLVHGDAGAKAALGRQLQALEPGMRVVIPDGEGVSTDELKAG